MSERVRHVVWRMLFHMLHTGVALSDGHDFCVFRVQFDFGTVFDSDHKSNLTFYVQLCLKILYAGI